ETELPHAAVRVDTHRELVVGDVGPLAAGRKLQDRVALVGEHLAFERLALSVRLAARAVLSQAVVDELAGHGRQRRAILRGGPEAGHEALGIAFQLKPCARALARRLAQPGRDWVLSPVGAPGALVEALAVAESAD